MENNTPLLERLERVIDTLSDNSIKMGQMLAVHDEKLDKQDRIDAVLFEKIESLHRELNRSTDEIKKGCERDIRLVDTRLRMMEKKMWSIFGALSIISFVVSPIGRSKNCWCSIDTNSSCYYNTGNKVDPCNGSG